jgi:hypothetical protein
MEDQTITGSCLCGEVEYQLRQPHIWFQYCHCSRCRKRSGTAHAANILIRPDQLSWLAGEDRLGRYELPEAKSFATCFCTRCGSPLPWATKNGKWMVVPAGSLNEDPGCRPERNIHWASRAPWYCHASELEAFPEIP